MTNIAKLNYSHTKKLLCFWWDQKGLFTMSCSNPMKLSVLSVISSNWLNWVTERKKIFYWRWKEEDDFVARQCAVKIILEVISDMRQEILPHAAYSSNLAPSEYHFFQSLQHYLVDSHFESSEEVDKSINKFINSKPPFFFRSKLKTTIRFSF